MKKTFVFFCLAIGILSVQGQDCVQIESILVDACTLGGSCSSSSSPSCNCEGKNEMLRFRVGDQDQFVDDLIIDWPNNGFQGICQNAQTAQNTAELNATIEACGYLMEPLDGVLPANSKVLVVTSADMCTASNSFTNLSDTLFILYQCTGNYQGHFANYGSGFRTTIVSFGGGCTSTATYNRALLVTQAGFAGAEDGATVNFSQDGPPVYFNDGCNAPVPIEIVEAGDPIEACPEQPINIAGFLQGEFTNWFWSGGSGTFANGNSLETIYTPGDDDSGTFILTLSAENCNGLVSDELEITIIDDQPASITPTGPLEICPGESVVLTAEGAGMVTWSSGESGNSIEVSEPGTYTATFDGPCGISEASIVLNVGTSPALSIEPGLEVSLCADESVELTAFGDGDFEWSTGSSNASISVDTPGDYTVSLTNECGTSSATVQVEILDPPTILLEGDPIVFLCEGTTTELSAGGEGNFLWSTGEVTSSITVGNTGVYNVSLSNLCGSDEQSIEVIDGGSIPTPTISVVGNTELCIGESTILVANTSDTFSWSTGSVESQIEVTFPGTYILSATNSCGTTEASVVISQLTPPLVTITAGDTAAICSDEEIGLFAMSSLPVTWNTGVLGSQLTVENPGTYYAYVSNTCGSDTAFITVLSGNPVASFTASADTGSVPLNITFDNYSTNAQNYYWSVNGDAVGNEIDLAYTFTGPGIFDVTLVAEDIAGCTSAYSLSVDVSGCPTNLFIPNAFSPNGDGINDLFKFVTQCVDSYELKIYNRWGTLIYTGQQGSPFWDGNNGHGSYVSNGVYMYVMEYKPVNGTNSIKSGTITVFR